MATDFEISLVRNIDRNELLTAISEREDIVEVMKMFRENKDYAQREYLTVPEFAEYIKASENYVRALAKNAENNDLFSVVRIGREYRIDRLSYEKWVRNGGRF